MLCTITIAYMNIIVNKYDRAVVYSSILLPMLYFKLLKLSDVMLSSRENPTFCIHKLNTVQFRIKVHLWKYLVTIETMLLYVNHILCTVNCVSHTKNK
jgi:hypothetical protein